MLIQRGRQGVGRAPAADGEQRFDIGNFESYFLAFIEFALADPQYGPALRRSWQTLPSDL